MSSIPLNLTPMTELDAVNMMLLSIGQSPVNSLNVPGIKDVSFALLMLHNTSRQVQSKGWWFNRDLHYHLNVGVDGTVTLPLNALQVTAAEESQQFVERNGKLYDRVNQTDLFPAGTVAVDVNWFFEFESIPQIARDYIAMRAGRIFQAQIVGSQILYQFTKEMEIEAMAAMSQQDLRSKRPNSLTAPTRVNRIIHRRR